MEPIKGMRKAMVKSMQVAQGIPHFGYCDDVDMTRLVALRKTMKKVAEKQGVKFSYMPLIIKVGRRVNLNFIEIFVVTFLACFCRLFLWRCMSILYLMQVRMKTVKT